MDWIEAVTRWFLNSGTRNFVADLGLSMYRRSAAVVEIKVDHRNSAVFTFYIAAVEMNLGRDEQTPDMEHSDSRNDNIKNEPKQKNKSSNFDPMLLLTLPKFSPGRNDKSTKRL